MFGLSPPNETNDSSVLLYVKSLPLLVLRCRVSGVSHPTRRTRTMAKHARSCRCKTCMGTMPSGRGYGTPKPQKRKWWA